MLDSVTLTSKATGTKRNVIALLSDNAVMYAIHHLVDICLQFQLYPLLFVHLVIVLGFWAVDPKEKMACGATTFREILSYLFLFFSFTIPLPRDPPKALLAPSEAFPAPCVPLPAPFETLPALSEVLPAPSETITALSEVLPGPTEPLPASSKQTPS